MLTLTTNGLLASGRHKCQPADVFDCFVRPFPQSNRGNLFDRWQAYNQRLKTVTGNQQLTQWVDGSFVTDKANPNDIDLVTFIPSPVYEPIVEQLIDYYSTFSLHAAGLDAYICPVYPVGHSQYSLFMERRTYWRRVFGNLKNDTGQKGFLEIQV